MEEMNKRIIKIEQPSKKSSFEIEMKNTENIKILKERIETQEGIPTYQQTITLSITPEEQREELNEEQLIGELPTNHIYIYIYTHPKQRINQKKHPLSQNLSQRNQTQRE